MKSASSLPVLMYHYVSRFENPISVSPEIFELHCKTMAENGWRGVGLSEAEAFLRGTGDLPVRSCLITFDDGYLDNYHYAWPILQKYGHKAVIFAVTDRIHTEPLVRPTAVDIAAGRASSADLPGIDQPFVQHPLGFAVREDHFFSWEEARIMEKSGVIRVSSHGATHAPVFTTDERSGFLKPGKRKRTFDRVQDCFWGMPLFPLGPGLANRAFLPAPDLLDELRQAVPQDTDAAHGFCSQPGCMAELEDMVAAHGANLGRMETDEEMYHRMHLDLARSKTVLERELGREEISLCWPWGKYSPTALQAGRDAGYQVFYTTREGANPKGEALAVHRFKAKPKGKLWLRSRLAVYGSLPAARLYARLRF